jgi:hypothetical protein
LVVISLLLQLKMHNGVRPDKALGQTGSAASNGGTIRSYVPVPEAKPRIARERDNEVNAGKEDS